MSAQTLKSTLKLGITLNFNDLFIYWVGGVKLKHFKCYKNGFQCLQYDVNLLWWKFFTWHKLKKQLACGKENSSDQWFMKATISHNPKHVLSFSLKQLFALLVPFILSADLMGAVMELWGNNDFVAPVCHYIWESWCPHSSPVWETDKCWRGWLHGSHKVTGSGAGSWPQSRQPDSGMEGVFDGLQQHRHEHHSLRVYLIVTTPISDIILILDRCTMYSTRIACHRKGIICIWDVLIQHIHNAHGNCALVKNKILWFEMVVSTYFSLLFSVA